MAPSVRPRTKCRCTSSARANTGTMATTASADACPQLEPCEPEKPATATGNVTALVRVKTTAKRNSIQLKMKAKVPVAISPGTASGKVMLENARSRVAPSTWALSSTSAGTASKYDRISQITKGKLKAV